MDFIDETMSEKKPPSLTENDLPPAVKLSVDASLAKQAENLVVLDLRGISSFTDFFIIMHGNSPRQNLAIADALERELRNAGIRPLSVEGREKADWILMDYGSWILHIFSEQARGYYELERLWADGPRLNF